MATETLEERVTAEKKDASQVRPGVIGRTSPDFLDRFFGTFADSPNFEAVMRSIEQERAREREEACRDEDVSAE